MVDLDDPRLPYRTWALGEEALAEQIAAAVKIVTSDNPGAVPMATGDALRGRAAISQRLRELRDEKQALDNCVFASDPDRSEALANWTTTVADALLDDALMAHGYYPTQSSCPDKGGKG